MSRTEAEQLGLPVGYKAYTPFPFSGLNFKDSIFAMEDQEFYWQENLIRVGDGYLRAVPGESTTDLFSGATVVFFFFYNLAEVSYCAVFKADGTAIQINVDSGAQTTISAVAGTFYDSTNPDALPACVQWGAKYLLITNNNTSNDYWIWDGSVLYTSGTLGPTVEITGTGIGYASAPTMTAYGGKGLGATFSAVIDAAQIVQMKVTNPGSGYQPGDYVGIRVSGGGCPHDAGQITCVMTSTTLSSVDVTANGRNYTTATVAFSGGGGTGAAATATIVDGKVTEITLTNQGTNYTSAPVVTISGDGTGAMARAYLTPTKLGSVTNSVLGSGYGYPPTSELLGGAGSGASISVDLQGTGLESIEVLSPGGPYTAAPTINVDVEGTSGTGGGGSATNGIREGQLFHVNVTATGSGYRSLPYTYPSGGLATGGTHATLKANLVRTTLRNSTSLVGNVGSAYTDAPTVFIGAGANNAAYARCEVMPFGVSGAAIETYQSRIWLVFPRKKGSASANTDGTMLVSDASELTGFPTVYVNEQSVLRARYTAIKQSNGYLYAFGDSSIDIISNVQTSGDPVITTFNYQNVEPQIGTTFRDTVQALGRSIYFANKNGVFRLAGGAVTRVSDQINNIFENAVFPDEDPTALTPSAATAYIHNVKLYLVLLTITDPFTETNRNVMLGFDETGWCVLTQETDYTFIATRVIEGDLQAYGTDGTNVTRLFSTPSSTLAKVLVTKLYGADTFGFKKLTHNLQLEGEDLSSDSAGATLSIAVNTEQPAPNNSFVPDYAADVTDRRVFTANAGNIRAAYVGLTLGSTSKDFGIYNIALGYTLDIGPIGADALNAPPAEAA